MNRAFFAAAVSACLCCMPAHAQTTKFDGPWKVIMVCPPHSSSRDDAKGYTHRFPAQVQDGQLTATHGTEGEPGWHLLRGQIQSDGNATLRLDGVVNNPEHAINDAPRGKQYSYRVKAHFDESTGTGQRLTGRVCEFQFSR